VGVDGGAQRPDAAADAPAAEALEQHVRQVVEVVVQDLGDFGVGAVFFGERAAGEAVDVRDGTGGQALLEDFGADEAGCAGEDDFGHCGLFVVTFGGVGGGGVLRVVCCRKWVKEEDVGKRQKQKERRVLYSSGFTLDGM